MERRAGGVDIEEVARDNPTALITESVDNRRGLDRDQALRIVNAIGFSPAVHNSVLVYIVTYYCSDLRLIYPSLVVLILIVHSSYLWHDRIRIIYRRLWT